MFIGLLAVTLRAQVVSVLRMFAPIRSLHWPLRARLFLSTGQAAPCRLTAGAARLMVTQAARAIMPLGVHAATSLGHVTEISVLTSAGLSKAALTTDCTLHRMYTSSQLVCQRGAMLC